MGWGVARSDNNAGQTQFSIDHVRLGCMTLRLENLLFTGEKSGFVKRVAS